MKDIIEQMEDAAEHRYYETVQPDGRLKCDCGRVFNPDDEGGPLSPNPYAMPVCGVCLDAAMDAHKKGQNPKELA
jgi:hypothetical protein